MKKNVVFWCAVNNPEHDDKYDSFKWFEYSRLSWKYWCDKHGVVFFEYTKAGLDDLMKHRVTWQRWFDVFTQLEEAGIEYDKIYMVDANSMIHWDTPNFFDLCTDNRLVGWRDSDNLAWIYDCIIGWDKYFNYGKFNISRYINAGCVIINETHKPLLEKVKDMYFNDYERLMEFQHQIKKGSDQGPLNFLIQMGGVEVNMDLPLPYKLTHMHRKDLYSHNWQLKIDPTPFFIKYGYIWIFNGFAKDERTSVMANVWNMIKDNYDTRYSILRKVHNKDMYKNATTLKFKKDFIDFFSRNKFNSYVELGCCQGDTLVCAAELFDSVKGYDWNEDNVRAAIDKCKDFKNVEIYQQDLINTSWEFGTPDVIFFDHIHNQIDQGLEYLKQQFPNSIIVMDDYGHEMNTIKPVIQQLIANNQIEVLSWIGEDKGFKSVNGKTFVDREGLIFKFK